MTIIYGWHHATAEAGRRALQTGRLEAPRPHAHGRNGIIWFTTNRLEALTFEFGSGGTVRCVAGQEAAVRSLFRFGRPVRSLLAGRPLRDKARIPAAAWSQFQNAIRAAGADLNDWFGSPESLNLSDLIIDRYDSRLETWERISRIRRVAGLGGVPLETRPLW